jgi:hypothetical protein
VNQHGEKSFGECLFATLNGRSSPSACDDRLHGITAARLAVLSGGSSALTEIEAYCVLRRLPWGFADLGAIQSVEAASCIGQLTLSTRCRLIHATRFRHRTRAVEALCQRCGETTMSAISMVSVVTGPLSMS